MVCHLKGNSNPSKRPEVRLKISLSNKGRPAWNKRLNKQIDIRIKHHSDAMKKFYLSEDGKKKLINWKRVGYNNKNKPNFSIRGENNHFWKGGITDETRKRTNSLEWRILSKKILKRDGLKCRKCGKTENLTVHHIIPYRKSKDNASINLITVCKSCHSKMEHQFIRVGETHFLRKLIDENGFKNL